MRSWKGGGRKAILRVDRVSTGRRANDNLCLCMFAGEEDLTARGNVDCPDERLVKSCKHHARLGGEHSIDYKNGGGHFGMVAVGIQGAEENCVSD